MRGLVLCVFAVVLASTARAERTTVSRPWSVSMDTSFGAPTGIFGASVGWMATPELELAIGGGLGFTGIQASLAARYHLPVGDSPTMSWVFGLGPSLAFRSESLGFHIERATDDTTIDGDKLYHTAWLNAELGWVARADWGGVLAISLGAGLRLADNQRRLCDGAPDEGGDCNPPHFGPGSIYAKAIVLPSFGMRFGWAF